MADVDGDGALDLFVARKSRTFPYAEGGELFLNRGTSFVLDDENAAVLSSIGMVNGALFSDVDDDGDSDLVLACEWGPVRILTNASGRLSDQTEKLGMARFQGWWNGVAALDADGDGRMDFIATNWGENTPFQAYASSSIRAYVGDFDGHGEVDLIEAVFDPRRKRWVPWRDRATLARLIPAIQSSFPTTEAFARAGLDDLLSISALTPPARRLEVNWLASSLFLNRDDHFEVIPLPIAAQVSPAFGVTAADFDGDGRTDIALCQNLFTLEPGTARMDAGRGLILRNVAETSRFAPLTAALSGLAINGPQCASAAADFNRDGRIDLVVTERAGPTHLFRNQLATPGIQVRFRGPPGNPFGIGLSARAVHAGSSVGPRQEIRSGSGYHSTDAPFLLFPHPSPQQIVIRWPGRQRIQIELPPDVLEVEVDIEGSVRRLR